MNCDDTTALDTKLMILMSINVIPTVFFVAICIGLFILMAVPVRVGRIFVVDVHVMTQLTMAVPLNPPPPQMGSSTGLILLLQCIK